LSIWNQGYFDTLLAIAASVLIAVLALVLQRRSKYVAWVIVGDTPLIVGHPGDQDQLVISYDGERIANPRLIEVRLENPSKNEVRVEDWATPFEIKVEDGRFRSATARNAKHGVLSGMRTPTINGDTVTIPPLLLNAGDWATFVLLVDANASSKPTVSCRVAGQTREPAEALRRPSFTSAVMTLITGLSLVYICVFIRAVFYPHYKVPHFNLATQTVIGTLQAGTIVTVVGVIATTWVAMKRLWIIVSQKSTANS
jgi:hypothetical protein